MTITDAAVDDDVTAAFCDLLDDGNKDCSGCRSRAAATATA
ncbi:hypothetical protein [Mycobacterium sp. M26]|nr:hypothetical protein [Mycobacterium sp. M26]